MLGKYNEDALSEAFDAVSDPADWRDEIDAVVEEEKKDGTVAAVAYYTGAPVSALPECDGYVRIRCVGYRNGPCGP